MRSFRTWLPGVVAFAALGLAVSTVTAQTPTTTSSTETRTFEIVSVDGNRVVVRGQQGTQEVTVTDEFRLTVDGKQITAKELRPGMKGTARVTTTTTVTPVTVTEVKSGEIIQVAGGSITVRTDEGFKMFTEGDVRKRGVTIMRDGKPISFSQLNRGDRLNATIITESAPKVVTQRDVDAMMTAPATAAARSGAAGGGAAAGGAAPAARAATPSSAAASPAPAAGAGAAPRQLPSTASPMPLVGLIGLCSLAAGMMLRARRLRG